MLNYAEGNENGIWGHGDFSTQAGETKELKKKSLLKSLWITNLEIYSYFKCYRNTIIIECVELKIPLLFFYFSC